MKVAAAHTCVCMSYADVPNPRLKQVETALKLTKRQVQRQLQDLTPAQLHQKLTRPQAEAEALRKQLWHVRERGMTAVVLEVMPFPAEARGAMAARCAAYAASGAVDVIALRTDVQASSTGFADLASVSQAVNVPVICSDWIIHPIQIAQAVEAGASAVRLVHAVVGKGVKPLLGYCGSLGLDAIVEVTNMKELEEVEEMGASIYGINLSIGISLPIPGFRQDIAKNLTGQMPFGALTIVGVSSREEAQEMRLASADAVCLRQEVIERFEAGGGSPESFLEELRYILSGDY